MNQFLIGVSLVALLFAGMQWYRADAAAENAASWQRSADRLTSALSLQTQAIQNQTARFEGFDLAMVNLQKGQIASDLSLAAALQSLEEFKPQPGDSDETIQCARTPVPLDVDRQLRE